MTKRMPDDAPPPAPPPPRQARVRAVVQPLPVQRELGDTHLEDLRGSGLTDATIAAAALYTERNARAVTQLLDRMYPAQSGPALVFPFFLPGADAPYAYRIKPTVPRVDRSRRGKPRPVKYDQSGRVGLLTYFPPAVRISGGLQSDATLYWTEGEKKALALDQMGLPVVGLTGVWNWIDPDASVQADAPAQLHPIIREHVRIRARQHVIVYDADVRQNPKSMLAAKRLAGVLYAAGAAAVRFTCPPTLELKGIDDYYAVHGLEAVCALLHAAEPIDPIDPENPRQRIKTIGALAGAPVVDAYVLPDGYDVHKDGSLWREAQGRGQVTSLISASGPILIERYLEDLYTHEGRADICYLHQGRWTSQCVSRQAVIDARSAVTELGPYGAPITSSNAAKTVDWLHALGALNHDQIPTVTSVSRVGWHDTGAGRVFVTCEPIAETGTTCPIALDSRGDRKRLYAALRPRGDAADHAAALRTAWDADTTCATVICAAFAAPLLELFSAPNFGVHLIGESSRGKTSMLRIAASVYGDPGDPEMVASWNATGVGAELRASRLSDLPQCYDEIGGGDSEHIDRLIYMLINGTGRVRGSRDVTLRETQRWRTILLSTGERELGGDDAATGARARIVHLPVSSFGDLPAADIDALRARCADNAGQLGRQWLQLLVDLDNLPEWVEQYRINVKLLREQPIAQGEGFHQRMAGYYALLITTEQLLQEIGIGHGGVTMLQAFTHGERRDVVLSAAERARVLVEDWVMSDPDAFPELGMSSDGKLYTPPSAARGGTTARAGFRFAGTIYVIPSKFEQLCAKHRLSNRTVIREWVRLGWSEVEPRHLGCRLRLDGGRPWFVKLGSIIDSSDDDP